LLNYLWPDFDVALPKSAIDFWIPVCPCPQAGGDRQEGKIAPGSGKHCLFKLYLD